MKLVPTDAKKLIKILERKGFRIERQKGSHVQLEDELGRKVTVPVHPGREIGRGLLRKILRDAEITLEEFDKLRQEV